MPCFMRMTRAIIGVFFFVLIPSFINVSPFRFPHHLPLICICLLSTAVNRQVYKAGNIAYFFKTFQEIDSVKHDTAASIEPTQPTTTNEVNKHTPSKLNVS